MVDPTKPIKPPGLRRRMVLQLVFAMVIFLSGTVIGTGGTMQWLKSRGGRIGPPPPRGRGTDPNELVARWTEEYGLSSEQGEEIKQVLKRVDQMRREAFQESHDKMEIAFNEMIEGIKGIMTPDQFKQWHEEFENRMQKYRGSKDGWRRDGRRGGSGGPGGPRGERGDRDPNRLRQRGPRPPEQEEAPI